MVEGVPLTLADQLNTDLEAPRVDPVHMRCAHDYLSGMDVLQIADKYDIDSDLVVAVLEKSEVKNYINAVFLSQGYLNRNNRLKLINDIIDQKMTKALEADAEISSKDILEWVKLANDMDKLSNPNSGKPTVAVQINNNYEDLIKDIQREGK